MANVIFMVFYIFLPESVLIKGTLTDMGVHVELDNSIRIAEQKNGRSLALKMS